MRAGHARRAVRVATTAALAIALTTATLTVAPAQAATLPYAPVADTYVDAAAASSNFGRSSAVIADNGPVRRTFLKFTLAGLAEPVASATLRLHVRNVADGGSPSGGTLRRMTNTGWLENAVTWKTQPAIDGATIGSLATVKRNTWYSIDVTSAVTGDGAYSFALTSANGDGAYYDSRESGMNAPQLIVTTTPPPVVADDQTLVGAGDTGSCGSAGDDATARLLDGIAGTVFTAGDNAYPDGAAGDYAACYAPSWGRHLSRTRPAPGNHEYLTAGAAAYFGYFGAAAGDPGKGYYSYDLGSWHVVSLNSNCDQVSCAAGSAQELWLRADLAASAKPCTVAYWHHPLFTSGLFHGPSPSVRPLYQALYDYNAEVVVTGHNHNYERFAPQDPAGALDAVRGIRQFVAGLGGASYYGFGTVQPNSEVRNGDTYGVLKLTLKAAGYDWTYVPVAGKTFTDSGSGTCH